ncbi:TPA: glutaredoxin [Vibrio cholerae]|uniref:Glutaredoxin-related protein n=7 Tax=Vibrio cholerae TaxID=666 RepID=Q9KKT9_VIBCH|nr:glutaredoxin-related protein [Vibrio cholerae O1 biovar El Tor str. N16961]ABQ19303.1 glutaredoxin family protein [Vibrio cholerae O395]ACP07929.1 glutaredoxin-related protein [Vibrio cholerae M66-2]ACQ62296.1 glutaredoxin [Vibrio cholerae MJ-1236]ARB79215.1 glutaredoxin [Vibrio cholerae]AVH54134.1 glutaredoxin [Vibrio cholerae O1 biovar El Tor]EAZ74386.1 glutaredoxin family protein [Vibrio cholerae NCTC 8457]EAZ76354.1 glutaredoxin family protein [Vibrio cholerae B33]EEO01620.1 glutared
MRIRNHLMTTPIKVTLYRWAGHFGPFKVNIPCGECTLTKDILADTFANELAGVPIELEVKDWLSYWWEPLKLGAWHAPIVVVAGKVISQGEALNRGVLVQSIIKEWTKQDTLQGNIVFGKATCPYCVKAKQLLDTAGIDYRYHDVVKESAALYRMIPEVKAIIGEKTPVTVPQIWLNGQYIGGCDALEKWLQNNPHALPNNVVEIETTRVAP